MGVGRSRHLGSPWSGRWCSYHAKPMLLLRLHARELVSVQPASLPVQPVARGWRIDSFPYSFQAAGNDVLFQLSIGSAVFFFLYSFPSPLLVLEMEPRALSIGYTFSTIAPLVLCICSVLCLLANAHFSPQFTQLECMRLAQLTFWV